MVGRLAKHLGEGEEVEINGDKFLLKPLTTAHIGDFLLIMKSFSGAGDGSVENLMDNLDQDGLNAIKNIIDATLEKSLPEESPEDRAEFGLKYMSILLGKIFEINNPKDIETIKKSKVMNKIRQKQNESLPKDKAKA